MPNTQYTEDLFNYSGFQQQSQDTLQHVQYPAQSVHNMYNPQGQPFYDFVYRTQYSQVQGNNPYNDNGFWMGDQKVPDKGQRTAVEITGKDLSPASFCGNFEMLLPEFCKSTSKDPQCNKVQEPQVFQGYNQKFDYSSCGQLICDSSINYTSNNKYVFEKLDAVDDNVRYCHNFDTKSTQRNGNGNKMCAENMTYVSKMEHAADLQHENWHRQTFPTMPVENNTFQTQQFQFTSEVVDRQTECSNDESDIIVEESDEEITDYSEDLDKKQECNVSCTVCGTTYGVGNQLFMLTEKFPVTTTSQNPVRRKLTELFSVVVRDGNHLCCYCLEAVNTIDYLQCKLEACKLDLRNKSKSIAPSLIADKPNVRPYVNSKRCKHNFKCKLCRKLFSLKLFYRKHMTEHWTKNRFLCDVCGRRFSRKLRFNLHIKRCLQSLNSEKTIVGVPTFACRICKKAFRTKTNLKDHDNFCSGRLPFKCKHPSCGKKFATTTRLKMHVKLKHDKKFSSICSICNIGFVKLSDYKGHMVSHSTEKKFECPTCAKTYKTLSNLNFHMKFHEKKLPFNCDVCPRGFMRKEYLESHVNGHNGVKNFSCSTCDKKFVSQKNLDAHVKYHDGSVNRKMCNVCRKMISSGMKDHMRTHTNLQEFKCGVCDLQFNTKNALYKHNKKKHH